MKVSTRFCSQILERTLPLARRIETDKHQRWRVRSRKRNGAFSWWGPMFCWFVLPNNLPTQTSSFAPVIIIMGTRGLCQFNINRSLDAVIFYANKGTMPKRSSAVWPSFCASPPDIFWKHSPEWIHVEKKKKTIRCCSVNGENIIFRNDDLNAFTDRLLRGIRAEEPTFCHLCSCSFSVQT